MLDFLACRQDCEVPENSSASWIADMAIAAGASMVDVPVSGCNGGIAASAGRPCWSGVDGQSKFINSVAPMKEATTTTAPSMIVRMFIQIIGFLEKLDVLLYYASGNGSEQTAHLGLFLDASAEPADLADVSPEPWRRFSKGRPNRFVEQFDRHSDRADRWIADRKRRRRAPEQPAFVNLLEFGPRDERATPPENRYREAGLKIKSPVVATDSHASTVHDLPYDHRLPAQCRCR